MDTSCEGVPKAEEAGLSCLVGSGDLPKRLEVWQLRKTL